MIRLLVKTGKWLPTGGGGKHTAKIKGTKQILSAPSKEILLVLAKSACPISLIPYLCFSGTLIKKSNDIPPFARPVTLIYRSGDGFSKGLVWKCPFTRSLLCKARVINNYECPSLPFFSSLSWSKKSAFVVQRQTTFNLNNKWWTKDWTPLIYCQSTENYSRDLSLNLSDNAPH